MAYKTPQPLMPKYNYDLIDRVQNTPEIDDDELLVEVLRRNADGLNLNSDDELLEAFTGYKTNPSEPGPNNSWTWKEWMKYNGQYE